MTFSTFLSPYTKTILAMACASFMVVGCSNMNANSTQAETADKTNTKAESADKSGDNANADSASDIKVDDIITGDSDSEVVASLTANLVSSGAEQTKIISAQPTNIEGMYWVVAEGAPPFFTNKSGEYIFQGQLIKVGDGTPVDIGAKLNEKIIQDRLAAVPKKDMVIYPAKGKTKSIVYVFTDSTCPYCQKLHDEVPEINEKGIEVRYLAWPRNERAMPIMEAVWCSDDRNKALDDTKAGKSISAQSCESPVKEQTDLGFAIGVRGTPAIYNEKGEQLGGYIPPAQLEKALGL